MKKYEYDWDNIMNTHSTINHRALLLERSNKGWEMVSTIMIEETLRIYWKREIN